MRLTDRRRRVLTGSALALGVLATRLPFVSHYLYEFDSIDFAVAIFRFDLSQFTPHPPGSILHVLLGRLFAAFTADINVAFVWLSIVLSIGSVLFFWRAAANLRGERAGVIAALLWSFAPMFWFYGEVATAYVHEAFFASALLYIGIGLLREDHTSFVYALAVVFALSIGARQSSALFFAPAVLYLLYQRKPGGKTLLGAALVFIVISAVLFIILIDESGGWRRYFAALGQERIYKTQSILFGNPLGEHFGVVTKFAWLLFAGALPVLLIALYGILVFRDDFFTFLKKCFQHPPGKFALLVALPALLFYSLIYFMKAGYLLNILPSVYLAGAVFADEIAILHARRKRLAEAGKLLLTRRLITQNTALALAVLVTFEVVWFTAPKGNFTQYADLYSHQTYRAGIQVRYGGQESKTAFALNRALAYTTASGVAMIDSIHAATLNTILHHSKDISKTVIFDTWWQRFSYYYFPQATGYDIRSYDADTLFSAYRMKDYTLYPIGDVEVLPDSTQSVLILIRDEHPDLAMLRQQVRLRKIAAPPHIDMYEVLDTAFNVKWKNVQFVKR